MSMKKLFSHWCALLFAFSLSAKTIYLNTGGNTLWGQASPEFFIHAWGAGDADVHMTVLANEPLVYQAEIPDGSTNCIFTRQQTGSTSIIWDDKNGLWNKTPDLTIDGNNNCYTIEEWSQGTWSVYTPSVEAPKYYITGNAALVGTDKAWKETAIEIGEASEENPATYTFTNLTPGEECQMKITNGTWDLSFGYDALNKDGSSEGITGSSDGNIVFTPATATAKVTFDGTKICLTGEFGAVEPVENITAYYINSNNWEKVYAYVFAGELNNSWPGAEMTKTAKKGNFDVYSYTFPETYTSIIFNNGNSGEGNQTADQTIDKTKLYFYNGEWYASLDDIEITTTGISNILINHDAPMFNVLGQQVDASYQGIILQDGKKFILR